MIDASGTPRSQADIEAALVAVKLWIVKEPLALGPDGTPRVLHLVVVREALEELLERRKADPPGNP